jgi:hypothetical protein
MKNLFHVGWVIIPVACLLSCQSPSGMQKPAEFESIFNGQDLQGWHSIGKVRTSIDTGILTLSNDQSGVGGWILTDKEYEDFHLKFEFLCPPPNNSGVAIRYHETKKGNPAVSAYEVNIYNTPNTQNPTGSVYNLARSFWTDSLKPEDWNQMEIIARGDCLVTVINGQKLVITHQRRIFRGCVGFQAHDGKVKHAIQLRNIQLKAFPTQEITGPQIEDYMRSIVRVTPEILFENGDLSNWETVGDGVWKVVNDHIEGRTQQDDFSFLKSVKTYQNYYLKLKFRIEKGHNSGVFIRQDPQAQEIGLETGMEINIYDHDGFSYGWPTGSNVTRARAFIGLVDYDDWNTMEIFAFERHICVYVNGLKASEYYADEKFNRPGNICLQVGVQVASEDRGGSEVGFKDIEIRDFGDVPFIGY